MKVAHQPGVDFLVGQQQKSLAIALLRVRQHQSTTEIQQSVWKQAQTTHLLRAFATLRRLKIGTIKRKGITARSNCSSHANNIHWTCTQEHELYRCSVLIRSIVFKAFFGAQILVELSIAEEARPSMQHQEIRIPNFPRQPHHCRRTHKVWPNKWGALSSLLSEAQVGRFRLDCPMNIQSREKVHPFQSSRMLNNFFPSGSLQHIGAVARMELTDSVMTSSTIYDVELSKAR